MGDLTHFLNKYLKNYDTIVANYDTKNLYKVKNVYYYRKKINYKLYRISLNTKSIKIALQRKKIFDKMGVEELMFTIESGDYKYIFEYETNEELESHLTIINKTCLQKDIVKSEKILNEIDETSKKIEDNKLQLTFAKLEILFVKYKKDDSEETQKAIKESTWKKWEQTFNSLKEFFDTKNIENLTIEDFKDFRKWLIEKGLKNGVINEKMMYLNYFLEFAILKKYLKENNTKEITPLFVEANPKEMFEKDDFDKLFNSNKIEQNVKNIFKILMYTGMRIHEFYYIKSENILVKDGINYLDLKIGKGKNGPREIPIHDNILDILKNFDFESIRKKQKEKTFGNFVRDEIYKEIKKGIGKSTHSFRSNFTNQLINNFPSEINLIQSILGHTQGTKNLTIKNYGKGFDLKNKKRLIDSIELISQ